jgi:hypothetical protein
LAPYLAGNSISSHILIFNSLRNLLWVRKDHFKDGLNSAALVEKHSLEVLNVEIVSWLNCVHVVVKTVLKHEAFQSEIVEVAHASALIEHIVSDSLAGVTGYICLMRRSNED